MDDNVKHYADTLYEQSLHESARILRDERVKSQQEMAARRSVTALPLSGPEIQTVLNLFVQHVERCMETRLESYRKAYSEAKRNPADEDFSEILASVKDAQDLQIKHSAQALSAFIKSSGVSGIAVDVALHLTASSAHGHDRVLGEWKVWRGQVRLAKAVDSDDRKFARMALDEAKHSIDEDDRVHPRVGAVIVKDGVLLSRAHRGESPESHAEFIALEKKLEDAAVAGATVYTTLEPCTTRKHPKIPCVERLIERKVARVVIGMLDPDPRITGRGQRRLREARIVVDTFPPDVADEVEELNRKFTRACESSSKVSGPPHHILGAQDVGALHKTTMERLSRHRSSISKKLENVKESGIVEIACCPVQPVDISVSSLEQFIQRSRLQFSNAMRHFPSVEVFQNGASVGYFPRGLDSTARFTLYKDGLVVFDALTDVLVRGDKGLHAGWLSYELQRHLQLAKELLEHSDVRSICVVLNLENIGSLTLNVPSQSGPWVESHEYAGPHEAISHVISLSEIYDHDGDKRNIVMPVVADIMDEVYRIFGLSGARGLWDDDGKFTYVKGLENQR